jgi:CheY-like chemotaxis protein
MKARILIVDDNVTNLKLTTVVLACEGYIVDNAENADRALAILLQFRPDLILMDISMPGMDGLTLTRQLKADPAMRNVPIVALTASAMKGDDFKARAAGCDGYITMPIDTRQFPGQIAAFLDGAAAPADITP